MSRISVPAYEQSPEASRPLLDAVNAQFGVIPNFFRLIAISPAALEGLMGLYAALSRTLDARTREGIAIAVAEVNGCDYCLSAHSYIAAHVAKSDADEIIANRQGGSLDARADAAIRFARNVAFSRGQIDDADIDAVRAAGFTDAQVIELIANVAINMLSNFANNVAQTDIDFPVVESGSL